jgi:hypothetical protein
MNSQDPLAIFHADNFRKTTFSDEENHVIESAKRAIANAANTEALAPELCDKYQGHLNDFIDMSPNKVAAASYFLERISEGSLAEVYLTLRNGIKFFKTNGRGRSPGQKRTAEEPGNRSEASGNGKKQKRTAEESGNGSEASGNVKKQKRTADKSGNGSEANGNGTKSVGRSSKFSAIIKAITICQVSGNPLGTVVASHILSFSARQGDKLQQYYELIKALFGADALQVLLVNVLNGDRDAARNINRLDNGIATQPTVHHAWDDMKFNLEVLWDTYDESTKEVMRYSYCQSLTISLILRLPTV